MENDYKSKIYGTFASVYDTFMDDIPYKLWCAYLIGLLREYKVNDGLVLELGCGTGNITRLMDRAGYDMIGVDNSVDMLEIAMEKKERDGQDILYLLQDMREFELYGTVKAVISVCDSINYITEEEELLEVFKLVNNYLDPKGIFVFDMNTEYKYKEVMGEMTIAENREAASFIWDNYYDEVEKLNEYDLALFIPVERDGELLHKKYEEIHYQKAYDLDLIKQLLDRAGMEFVAAYDAFTRKPPHAESERIYIVARENGK